MKRTIKRSYKKNKISYFVLFLVCLSFFITVGYSYLNSQLSIKGEVAFRAKADIRFNSYELLSTESGAVETSSSKYGKTTLITELNLPNLDSTATYEATIINKGTLVMTLDSIEEILSNNTNITYQIDGVSINDLFMEIKLNTHLK